MSKIFLSFCIFFFFIGNIYATDDILVVQSEENENPVDVQILLHKQIVQKYKTEVDRVINIFNKKLEKLPKDLQKKIRKNMREDIEHKYEQIRDIKDISLIRKEIILEILGYMIEKLD